MERIRRARQSAKDESGFALIIVVGVASILTLLATSSLVLSQQAVLGMQRAAATQKAFQAANAGIDCALARLSANPTQQLSWPATGTVAGADFSVVATLCPGSEHTTYTVTSTGTYNHVSQRVSQQYIQEVAPGYSLWDSYVFPVSGMNAVNGWSTSGFWGPVYVAGNFEVDRLGGLPPETASRAFDNNVCVYNGQSYIKKGVDDTYAPMNLLANVTQTLQNPITGGKFAMWSMDCPQVTLPTFGLSELQSEWTTAGPNSRVPTTAPSPTVLEHGPSPLTITKTTPTTTFCVNASGVPQLMWTISGGNDNKGLLTINGVIYVDGDLTLPACNYTGKGTLVVRGNVTCSTLLPMQGELLMNSAPQYTPLSDSEVLGIITPFDMSADPGPGNNTRKDYKGDFGMAGAFYVGGTVTFHSNNNRVKGAMVAGGCNAQGHNVHLVVDPDMPNMLPPDMPGMGAAEQPGLIFRRLFKTWSRS